MLVVCNRIHDDFASKERCRVSLLNLGVQLLINMEFLPATFSHRKCKVFAPVPSPQSHSLRHVQRFTLKILVATRTGQLQLHGEMANHNKAASH